MNGPLHAATLLTAVGSAAMGGIFFGFSAFVMPGLRRLPAAQGAAAMRSINVTAVRAPFMAALFGTAALCGGLTVVSLVSWDASRSPRLLGGALLYLVGVIGTTAVANVPRNDALAAADPDDPATERLWAVYLTEWTRWNSLRATAGLVAAVPLILALQT